MTPRDWWGAALVVAVLGLALQAGGVGWGVWVGARAVRADQALADAYAVHLDHGRSHAVEWAVCGARVQGAREAKDAPAERVAVACGQAARARAMTAWLPEVYGRLRADFGRAIAESWKLGADLSDLGTSERREHQARLLALDRLLGPMRDGTLRRRAAR